MELFPPTAIPSPTEAIPSGFEVYIVQQGDTLYEIAVQFGIFVNAIVEANDIPDRDRLSVGDRLLIPIFTPTPTPTNIP